MIAKISLYSKIFGYSEIVLLHVFGFKRPHFGFSISTLTVMILFRIDWVFHLFVRLYKPTYKHFVTKLSFKAFFDYSPCSRPLFAVFYLLFLLLSRLPNTPFEDENSKDVWLRPLNLEEEGF